MANQHTSPADRMTRSELNEKRTDIERDLRAARILIARAGVLREPEERLLAPIAALATLHKKAATQFDATLGNAAGVINATVERTADERFRNDATSDRNGRERFKRREAELAIRSVRSQVAEQFKDEAAAKAQAAAKAGEALDRAIEAAEANERMPLSLRIGPNAGDLLALMQLSEMRASLQSADPAAVAQMWTDLQKVGADDAKLLAFAHVVEPAMTEITRHGVQAIKAKAPRTPEGFAEKQIQAAHALLGAIAAWRESRQPNWLRAGLKARELLRRAFRRACGLDVAWLSSADVERLYLGSTMGHDPDREPYKLARLDEIATRFLPARLDPPSELDPYHAAGE